MAGSMQTSNAGQRLPNELLRNITGFASDGGELKTLRMVNSAMNKFAIPLLFEAIWLDATRERMEGFRDFVTAAPDIAKHVKALMYDHRLISITNSSSFSGVHTTLVCTLTVDESIALLTQIISQMPKLAAINLEEQFDHSIPTAHVSGYATRGLRTMCTGDRVSGDRIQDVSALRIIVAALHLADKSDGSLELYTGGPGNIIPILPGLEEIDHPLYASPFVFPDLLKLALEIPEDSGQLIWPNAQAYAAALSNIPSLEGLRLSFEDYYPEETPANQVINLLADRGCLFHRLSHLSLKQIICNANYLQKFLKSHKLTLKTLMLRDIVLATPHTSETPVCKVRYLKDLKKSLNLSSFSLDGHLGNGLAEQVWYLKRRQNGQIFSESALAGLEKWMVGAENIELPDIVQSLALDVNSGSNTDSDAGKVAWADWEGDWSLKAGQEVQARVAREPQSDSEEQDEHESDDDGW